MKIFSSEAVRRGHPDKLADAISDGILDGYLSKDPESRVAAEVMIKSNRISISGEVTSKAEVDLEDVARSVIRNAGYETKEDGVDPDSCRVDALITRQDPELADSLQRFGSLSSGDQAIVFGYATDESEEFLPQPYVLAQKLAQGFSDHSLPFLRPDGKVLCTMRYEDAKPKILTGVMVSLQSKPDIQKEDFQKRIKGYIQNEIGQFMDKDTQLFVNQFFSGGPYVDTGLTGRKIMVDTYGTLGPHGGGGFSGKDPTKMDRSGAYAARYIAKNIVAAKLCSKCSVQMTYVIGVQEPVAIAIDMPDKCDTNDLISIIKENFPITPSDIIDSFQLKKPIYSPLSFGGHFGRDAAWEKTDKVHVFSGF